MAGPLRPSDLGFLTVPGWQMAPHIVDMEGAFCRLVRGDYRRLLVSIPIRHGKSEYANLFIAWTLISAPATRILRVMAASKTAEMEALHVIGTVEKYGPLLTGAKMDARKSSTAHFKMEAGGELRSIGAAGDVESWTFDLIVVDDLITDPYEIRNPNRRTQIYNDLNTKFLSRVSPVGETKFVVIGSRRHPDDPQGRLLEASRNAPPDKVWHYHCRPAIADVDTPNERALWPTSSEFTLEGLKAIRDQKIADGVGWEWYCNYQNDAIGSPDMLGFDPAWFDEAAMFYDFPSDALPPAKFRVLATDPSMGAGNEMNDFFASVYLHIEPDGMVWLDDSFIAVCKPDFMIPSMANFIQRHQDVDIAPFEANAGGLYAAELIKRECDLRGLRFPVVFKSYSGTVADEKIARITFHLWEILQNRKLRLRDTPMNRALYRQLRAFPTEKLDGPDAMATGVIVLKEMMRR
jgi:hypothetical protein